MNKIVYILLLSIVVLAKDYHLINDNPCNDKNNTYNMVIEIPAGTNSKWEVSKKDGKLIQDQKNGKNRVINFLPYPANYGFVPQTKLLKSQGGDGDPIDILLLSNSIKRGSVIEVHIIGGLDFLDRGEVDTKLIAVPIDGVLSEISSLEEMNLKHPNILNIIKLWFEGYKGFGKMQFMGYLKKEKSIELVEKAHKNWVLL